MLIENNKIRQNFDKIVGRLTSDHSLQQDLMQECLIRLWKLEQEGVARTDSWYLQSCRFHLQHLLAAGRSVDSLKRDHVENRLEIELLDDECPSHDYHTNGELFETVSARDLLNTLRTRLGQRERAVLDGLAEGMQLREVAAKLKLSYPTALKLRRKIAVATRKICCCASIRNSMPARNGNQHSRVADLLSPGISTQASGRRTELAPLDG